MAAVVVGLVLRFLNCVERRIVLRCQSTTRIIVGEGTYCIACGVDCVNLSVDAAMFHAAGRMLGNTNF